MWITKKEILAGLATFMAGAYIVVVNPAILGQAGLPVSGVLTATALLTFVSTLAMGWYAKSPILVAPGMGMNAFFTYTAVLGMGISYQQALGTVFWAGTLFLVLSIFKWREKVVQSIPETLKHAVAAAIGLFIAFIGLQNAGVVIKNPVTAVSFGSFVEPSVYAFFGGLLLTAWFHYKKIVGAILWGMLATTALYYLSSSQPELPKSWVQSPDFSTFLVLDLKNSFLPGLIFIFAFTDLFDSISTLMGLSNTAKMTNFSMKKALQVDAASSFLSGIFGTSPGTAYIESAVGIEAGGSSGKSAIVTAFLFLPCIFLAPVITLIPACATAVALVFVGIFILKPLQNIDWMDIENSLPSFLVLLLTPLTYSLTTGLVFGILSYVALKVLFGKWKDLNITLLILSILCIILLFQ